MGLKESGLRASVRSVSTVVPAFFDVAITDTNSPVNEGDVLVVDYSVDNTGDSFETQDIRLEIESVQEDADLDVSLSGGASDSGTLEWDTTGQDADTYEATVLSDDDSDTVTVEIPDAFFDVAIQSTNSPVEEGETLNVDYLVDNTGGVEDTQDIRLEIDNTQEDVDTDITLDSGTSTTGTLQWDTTDESADTYSATVLSDDDSDNVTVEVESAIPDSGVLLDDFSNGPTVTSELITDRKDFGELEYQEIRPESEFNEAPTRPEWNILRGNVDVQDGKLQLKGSSERDTVTRELTNQDRDLTFKFRPEWIETGDSAAQSFSILVQDLSDAADDGPGQMSDCYLLFYNDADGESIEFVRSENGSRTTLISGTKANSNSGPETITVEKTGDTYELFNGDGVSQGTTTDTTFTDGEGVAISNGANEGAAVDFVEIY